MNKIKLSFVMALMGLLLPHHASAHARLVLPVPRDVNPGNKVGPCGSFAKPTVASTAMPIHEYAPGATVDIEITEVIDHPGRYFINFASVGQTNFQQYRLLEIPDVQNPGTLPHKYTAKVTLPNITCDSCTIQMIQSMEENPAAPSFYYSCADVKLVAPTTTPPPTAGGGQNGAQDLSSSAATQTPNPGFGCGLVSALGKGGNGRGGGSGPSAPFSILLLLPLMAAVILRAQSPQPVRIKRKFRE